MKRDTSVSYLHERTPIARVGWPSLSETPVARRRASEAGPWHFEAADPWRRDHLDENEWNECENVRGKFRSFVVD